MSRDLNDMEAELAGADREIKFYEKQLADKDRAIRVLREDLAKAEVLALKHRQQIRKQQLTIERLKKNRKQSEEDRRYQVRYLGGHVPPDAEFTAWWVMALEKQREAVKAAMKEVMPGQVKRIEDLVFGKSALMKVLETLNP